MSEPPNAATPARKTSRRKIAFYCGAAVVGAWIVNQAVAGKDDTPRGNPAVHERIAGETDCAEVQSEFDVASDRATRYAGSPGAKDALSYMNAAMDRGRELGCPGF